MHGKKQNIRRNDFLHFGEAIGLSKKSAEKIVEKFVAHEEAYIKMCQDSFLPDDMKERMQQLIRERIGILKKSSAETAE
jgi:serine/threonine-protein kinase HipA